MGEGGREGREREEVSTPVSLRHASKAISPSYSLQSHSPILSLCLCLCLSLPLGVCVCVCVYPHLVTIVCQGTARSGSSCLVMLARATSKLWRTVVLLSLSSSGGGAEGEEAINVMRGRPLCFVGICKV